MQALEHEMPDSDEGPPRILPLEHLLLRMRKGAVISTDAERVEVGREGRGELYQRHGPDALRLAYLLTRRSVPGRRPYPGGLRPDGWSPRPSPRPRVVRVLPPAHGGEPVPDALPEDPGGARLPQIPGADLVSRSDGAR